ncbi:SNO1 [Candida pseudojiufengensis]|uniref:SNO1 n=1 Tax=Candida pseudojiufengensis TaxID=497109 RepID=UPI0022240EB0|nr:SNO1 [Candida pseudojiufengensis]KAI5960304.1 SNO1 [Candida pseudojiufengensis]
MTVTRNIVIGVLSLQGAFLEHSIYLKKAIANNENKYLNYSFEVIEVRTKDQLEKCDSLVIPGGESSAMSYIAERTELLPSLYKFVADESKSIWGTCAGLIFLSKEIINGLENQRCLGGLDIQVNRNAFGRQIDSFEKKLDFSEFIPDCKDFPTVFIRAPVVTKILNETTDDKQLIKSENNYQNPAPVEVLYKLHNYHGDNELIVAVRQGRILGTSFHPELSDDYRFHQWFIDEFVLKTCK